MSREDCRRARHDAFTLIELLVVIAIIAMLIGILLPALKGAREVAKRNACLAQMKSIAMSSLVYAADDANGFSIPVHPLQYHQDPARPTYIGAYEWGGKSGIGRDDWVPTYAGTPLGSKYGTAAGFGPATRPLNAVVYKGGLADHGRAMEYEGLPNDVRFDRVAAQRDTHLELDLFKCPADDGPPRGAHCPDWLANTERSSYDHFGTSYAANIFMIASQGGGTMRSNSPYLRPTTRVPTPARTLFYEENIGRWAWSCRRELPDCLWIGEGVDPGPTKALRGWHGRDWTFNRAFVDSHAETQRVYIEGTEDAQGYALHYTNERLAEYPDYPDCENCQPGVSNCPGQPGGWEPYRCIIVRGQGWQKDTMPAPLVCTGLVAPTAGRPSYGDCVQ